MFGLGSRPIYTEVALQASRSQWRGDASVRLVAEGKRFLELRIDDDKFELEVRRKGTAVRFLSPSLRLPRSVRPTESTAIEELDTLLLRAVVAPWWINLAAQTRAAHDEVEMRLHPLAGWSLLVSNPRSPSWPPWSAIIALVVAVPVAWRLQQAIGAMTVRPNAARPTERAFVA